MATAADVPYRWVTGDCVYGDYRTIRLWLEEAHKCYVLCVSGKEYIQIGRNRVSVSSVLGSLDEERWFEASCGDGSKGARIYDWQAIGIDFDLRRVGSVICLSGYCASDCSFNQFFTLVPSSFPSNSAIMRHTTSPPPPTAQGQIIVMVLLGKSVV